MAISEFKYCSQRDVKDVYPNIDEFDSKVVIRNWGATDTTDQYQANDTGLITQLYIDGVKGTSVSDNPDANYEYNYSSATDSIQVFLASDPNELLMEAGEDWATLIDRMIVNCSMELSAMLDARFPRPIPKSFQYAEATDGSDTPEYDYILKRTTALLVAHHLLVSKNPISEEAIALKEQIDDTVDKINGGKIKFAFEIDPTDTGGDIVEVTRTGSMYLVETGGTWYGEAFDRVKIKCSTAGVYGTAKVDVSYYGDAKLYGSTITGVIVSGALTDMLLGLAVRFEGNSMAVNDEWHVIVRDFRETSTNSGVRSIESTSGNRINKVVYKKGIEV